MLTTKQISAIELLNETIARIETYDKKINAMPVRDFERARTVAKAADDAIARGKSAPLLGLPMSVKESFHVHGLATTWANPQFKDWQPKEDALTVSRLKAAGANIIGKTNVPFMLSDWQSYNDIYGTTNNPWNVNLTPGGSSGGAAAALAAGFVSLELGSDLAGSLRAPAHFSGVCAHKPTQDLVPMRGSSPPNTPTLPHRVDMVVSGPMARTAADLALGLQIIAGPDEWLDGKGYILSLPPPRHQNLKDYRVLVIDVHPLCPTASSILEALDELANHLIQLGVTVTRNPKVVPDLARVLQHYDFFLSAFSCADTPLDTYEQATIAAKKLSPDDMSLDACLLRGGISTHRDWKQASRIRQGMQQQWRKLFKDFDLILCPGMPTLAFAHDHSDPAKRKLEVDDKLIPYGDQVAWASIATFFGLPATVVPIAQSKEGLPIGIQIIGDYLEDYTTIHFAHLLEQEFGGFSAPPEFA